ncbi:alpha/beta fold hydrolase [Ancylobacter sp. 6x-1]|uniref:Alpha/beta fold hydrolase n=1 Tax=Ancylobacter crimeensis TaxID=2579147 RepID=A0ABT0D7R2_9HYPH|nr:alpha/beta fold hydrolase [Ancylobacter crimeensis]MCK0195983.1 alpha/beta fold hydrolase [Ancylobacter crimeensis]
MKVETVAMRSNADEPQTASHAAPPKARRRLVLFLPGHDATDLDYHHGRFAYQAGLCARLWSFAVETSERLDRPGDLSGRWRVWAQGPNWRQETDYEVMHWDDIVHALDARSDVVRLWYGFRALWNFLITGTAWRYMRACIRYGLFFFFPIAVVALFLLAGLIVTLGLGFGLSALFAHFAPDTVPDWTLWLVGTGAGLATFLTLFHTLARRWRVHHALDDWDLARDYMKGRTPALDVRLEVFATHLAERVRSGGHDEVVLVGHSLGATLALRLLDHAFTADPFLAEGRTRLCLLSCGSTIPKLALHPEGRAVRTEAKRIAATPGLFWVEYQARHDAINFYKFDPVRLKRAALDVIDLPAGMARPMPVLRTANIKTMLSVEKLHRLRWHMMRLHYQFMLANERPAAYDYFAFILGPVPLPDMALSRNGPADHFGPSGEWTRIRPETV